VTWTPETFASYATNRGVVDEAVSGGTEVLSWEHDLGMLTDAVAAYSDRTTAIWEAPPPAGPFSKVGTSGLPRAGGQRLRFEF
jgi:hypothetical protein